MSKRGLRDLAQQIEEVAREHSNFSQVTGIIDVAAGYINALARISEINSAEARHSIAEVRFDYINHEGRKGQRRALIRNIRWGTSDWYATPQWLLLCWDLDKQDMREFALANMSNITQVDLPR
jgi:predicted DNA-binding transcriptional regulator YafY